MNVPFEYIKIDLRDFNSIKDLKRSLRDKFPSMIDVNEVSKYLFHIKDDKSLKIILVDKIYLRPFAYYDKDGSIQLFQYVEDEMKNEKSLKFIPKGDNKIVNKITSTMSLDSLLDKIGLHGMKSLSKVEIEYLREKSNEQRS